jgi:DNA polymerase III delta prime subunit
MLSPLQEKLHNFITHKNVPHLLFYGVSGSGKKTLVNWFIQTLYKDKETIKEYVMYVNCGHCKGIQFVRGELKFFSKTNININGHGGHFFKSVVLLNADKLTIDAQSAMRRCIEIFSHNTRFFIVVDDKCKILKPILSRLCEIYLPPPNLSPTIPLETMGTGIPYMSVFPKQTHPSLQKERLDKLKDIIRNIDKELPEYTMFDVSKDLYEKSFTGIELMNLIEKEYESFGISMDSMVELLFTFNKIKREIKNESMFMFVILYTLFYDPTSCSRFIHSTT